MGSTVYKPKADGGALDREFKCVVSCTVAREIRDWARERIGEVSANSHEHGGESVVDTIYFDTDSFDVFHKRRSFRRSKYRIRRYGESETIVLGRRMSRKRKSSKRETVVEREALDVLDSEEVLKDWEGYWFHRRLLLRQLHPVCQISFLRTEFVTMTEYGVIRLVVDQDFLALPVQEYTFNQSGRGRPFLEGRAIVKVSYPNQAPSLLKRLIEAFALNPKSVSKYRLAVKALGIAPKKHASKKRAKTLVPDVLNPVLNVVV